MLWSRSTLDLLSETLFYGLRLSHVVGFVELGNCHAAAMLMQRDRGFWQD